MEEVFKQIESDEKSANENKLMMLELKGQLLMSKAQFPQALPIFEEYHRIVIA